MGVQDEGSNIQSTMTVQCANPTEPLVDRSTTICPMPTNRSSPHEVDDLTSRTFDENSLAEIIYLQVKGEKTPFSTFIVAISGIVLASCSLFLLAIVHSGRGTILTLAVEQESANQPTPVNLTWPIHERSQDYPLTTFHCLRGYVDYPNQFLSGVFPEYKRHVNLRNISQPPEDSTEYDLVIFGKHRGKKKTCPMQEWIDEDFKGKLIYFDSESLNHGGVDVDMRGSVSYEIGPRPDSIRSVQVFFAVQYLGMMGPSTDGENERIYKPELKPRSSGENFLIYANSNPIYYRDWAFHNLSSIGLVHYAGECKGIDGITTNALPVNNSRGRNYRLYRDYRFCLVMENVKEEGYITEKIVDAFLGGCIPIYYGTKEVFNIFNDAAFIYYDVENSQPALETVAYLETNQSAYEEFVAAPILAHGESTLKEYFSYTDEIGGGKLKSRIRSILGMP